MKCPNCGQTLAMASREGIEIDFCPSCRGVWLDRGELDKIIERAAAASAPADYERRPVPDRRYEDDDRDHRDRRAPHVPYGEHDDHGRYGKRKRRSFLDDIFDFD